MSKTFELPTRVDFTIPATGDTVHTLYLGEMDNESLLKGLVRGLKNICGDAVGSKEMTLHDKVNAVADKVARFQAGEIGDGVGSVSPMEKELRTLFEAWLVSKGAKKSDAAAVARKDGVEKTFMEIVRAKGLDENKGAEQFMNWCSKARTILATRVDDTNLV
jgi:hypothetical protein